MIVLGIESSCDETSASIVKDYEMLSNIVYSQEIHTQYGGVVPELASREHQKNITYVVNRALQKSDIQKNEIDGIAVTYGAGLKGALLVGLNFAKGMSMALNIPYVGVNHLEGHLFSNIMENTQISFPFISLIVSGGHTQIWRVNKIGDYDLLANTVDDAAGEAFDKGARLIGLSYPGGPEIERLAIGGNIERFELPMPLTKRNNCEFSFSGLKTAALNTITKNKKTKIFLRDFSASFQHTVFKVLEIKISNSIKLLQKENIKINDFSICGGVAANKYLNTELQKLISTKKLNFHQVPLSLSVSYTHLTLPTSDLV